MGRKKLLALLVCTVMMTACTVPATSSSLPPQSIATVTVTPLTERATPTSASTAMPPTPYATAVWTPTPVTSPVATPNSADPATHSINVPTNPVISRVITPTFTLLPIGQGELAVDFAFVAGFAFVDARHGWVASGIALLATDDGGRTWQPRYTAAAAITALDFVSSTRGWLVSNGRLWATKDGGRSWQSVAHAPQDAMRVDFVDARHGWLEGIKQQFFVYTQDGGATWNEGSNPCAGDGGYGNASRFSFIGPETGWMLCTQGTGMTSGSYQEKQIFTTHDHGQHWQKISESSAYNHELPDVLPLVGNANYIFFRDSDHGWISSFAPMCMCSGSWVTSDGGRSWQDGPSFPRDRAWSSLRFITPSEGYALASTSDASRVLMHTSDGGMTWTQLYAPLAPIAMPYFADPLHAVAKGTVTDPEAILTTDDGGASWNICGPSAQCKALLPANMPNSQGSHIVWRIDADPKLDLWSIVGSTTWMRYDPQIFPLSIADCVFLDANHGWLFDGVGHLYSTSDGGLSWTQLT